VPIPNIVCPNLAVLFCGINPGTRSGELGQHFARPGNRFWKVLHLSGFTDRLLRPDEQWALLDYGIGITNLVARTSAAASELSAGELRQGAGELEAKVAELSPRGVAVRRPRASIGRQNETIGSGTRLWVLPNPSGLQARYQLAEMVELYAELRQAL
jgi:TDG/mug DNA glycosylase family protein